MVGPVPREPGATGTRVGAGVGELSDGVGTFGGAGELLPAVGSVAAVDFSAFPPDVHPASTDTVVEIKTTPLPNFRPAAFPAAAPRAPVTMG